MTETAGADPYDGFAADYHWLLSDDLLSGRAFLRDYGDVLDRLPAGAAVLDCACGIGVDAIAAARRGFRVWASDGSPGMVAEAARRITDAGVKVALSVCRWEDLPGAYGQRFSAVFCLGNALAHALGPGAMGRALAAMHAVLQPGGLLVVHSRDWELLRHERPRITVADRVIERNGRRATSLYVWTLPRAWESPHAAEIVFVVEDDGVLTFRRHQVRFRPFTQAELVRQVETAGFGDVQLREQPAGRYRLVATARSAAR